MLDKRPLDKRKRNKGIIVIATGVLMMTVIPFILQKIIPPNFSSVWSNETTFYEKLFMSGFFTIGGLILVALGIIIIISKAVQEKSGKNKENYLTAISVAVTIVIVVVVVVAIILAPKKSEYEKWEDDVQEGIDQATEEFND